MKKKVLSVCCTFLLVICMLLISANDAQAASDDPILDGSYLTHDEESVGYATLARGVDLLACYSKCVRLGPGKIYAGGTTIAAHEVDLVKVAVVIERAKEGDTSWTYYDNWFQQNKNADRVSSNKTLEVEGGYYYRVSCIHSAHHDVGDSFTNGVYIEKP